ncbi:MAG TPA: hypothetical protein VN033_10300 [Vulgatibacter sp.]|nr:hypothetical protein [Vulgatibacter sp.]
MPKYWIRSPRYINGVYIFASPEFPAEVELPEGTKVDPGLAPFDEKPEKPVPHFAQHGGTPSAAEAFGPKDGEKSGKKGVRASDRSI